MVVSSRSPSESPFPIAFIDLAAQQARMGTAIKQQPPKF